MMGPALSLAQLLIRYTEADGTSTSSYPTPGDASCCCPLSRWRGSVETAFSPLTKAYRCSLLLEMTSSPRPIQATEDEIVRSEAKLCFSLGWRRRPSGSRDCRKPRYVVSKDPKAQIWTSPFGIRDTAGVGLISDGVF
jgi:hypothetical protein